MNKSELIDFISKKAEMSKKDASKAVEAFVDAISTTLEKGGDIVMVGFGTFCVKKREKREGRNPRTGQVIKIDASNVVKFKPGKTLKEVVNK